MGLRFRKSINLGKGVRINVSKSGIGISGGLKGFRVGVGPRGLRTTASIPGTGISYVKEKSLVNSRRKAKPRIEVKSKSAYSPYLPQEVPKNLKSNKYHLQGILGLIGIAFIFASFKNLSFLLIGIILIYTKGVWRKNTDFAAKSYRDAVNYFKSRKYDKCIEAINGVFSHPQAPLDLYLVQGECFLELDKIDEAYDVYKKYFVKVNPNDICILNYWPPIANTIAIAIDKKDFDFALKLIENLPEEESNDIDFPLWKNYFKGLCSMGKKAYEEAIEGFKKAVGRKRRMEKPYIDCHYNMGIAYYKLGKINLAHQRFERVYAANSNYKNISVIMKALSTQENIDNII